MWNGSKERIRILCSTLTCNMLDTVDPEAYDKFIHMDPQRPVYRLYIGELIHCKCPLILYVTLHVCVNASYSFFYALKTA